MLKEKLKYLDDYNGKRKQIAMTYSKELAGLLVTVPEVEREDRESCWHQYAILADRKDELIKYLEDAGIGAGIFYPVPLHLQKVFRSLEYQEGELPIAEEICRKSVCLPMFPELIEEEMKYVAQTVRRFYA